jgi:hypothetical protein
VSKKLKQAKKKLHRLGHHMELGQEKMSNEQMLLLNTYQKFFSHVL